jgi:adenosylcobinamide-phosphate synthase
MRRSTFAMAYLLDWLAGDPEWFPHPVRLIGHATVAGEHLLRKPQNTDSQNNPAYELIAGALLTGTLVLTTYYVTRQTIRIAYRTNALAGRSVESILGWTCLASRSLHDEASSVLRALASNDLSYARSRLSRIVGRDTDSLDEQEICRALIETVAESTSDGVIAPMFYMALGGVPLAMSYKTINTLDSMIGHTTSRYFHFGKFAARLDDIANFVPSRLAALGIAVLAGLLPNCNASSSVRTWQEDNGKHRSPNAGQPESAMAGALQVRLGGLNIYDGKPQTTPELGSTFPQPTVKHARTSLRLAAFVSIVGFAAVLIFRKADSSFTEESRTK